MDGTIFMAMLSLRGKNTHHIPLDRGCTIDEIGKHANNSKQVETAMPFQPVFRTYVGFLLT